MIKNIEKTPVSDVAFTPAVKAAQEKYGARKSYARVEQKDWWKTEVTEELAQFIAQRDSFYLATASADGQPYIQHRGGPKGFLKIIDEHTLAMADYRGNRQYISVGNLSENDRITIFLMDYPNRRRIKIWGRAEVIDRQDNPRLMEKLADSDYPANIERAIVFTIDAWDGNCPQHIKPRFTEEEIAPLVKSLQKKIDRLEMEKKRLKRLLKKI